MFLSDHLDGIKYIHTVMATITTIQLQSFFVFQNWNSAPNKD